MVFRSELTGDTNYLSSPILTMRRILSHPMLHNYQTFVDIGCGEGLVGVFVRLIQKKSIVLHDTQPSFLTMISFYTRLFSVSRVTCSGELLKDYPEKSVFLCVWTSWSTENRQHMMEQLSNVVPKDGVLIMVSHAMVHPMFIEVDKITETFAWGKASVYYYKHA